MDEGICLISENSSVDKSTDNGSLVVCLSIVTISIGFGGVHPKKEDNVAMTKRGEARGNAILICRTTRASRT